MLTSFELLRGRREVVTERRRKQEFAQSMRRLAEELYPQAEKVRVRSPGDWPEGSSLPTRQCMARG